MTETYTITDGPAGRLWWAPGEVIPADHAVVRPATPAETSLMRRIEKHRDPPQAWGDKIYRLIQDT